MKKYALIIAMLCMTFSVGLILTAKPTDEIYYLLLAIYWLIWGKYGEDLTK